MSRLRHERTSAPVVSARRERIMEGRMSSTRLYIRAVISARFYVSGYSIAREAERVAMMRRKLPVSLLRRRLCVSMMGIEYLAT